MPKATLAGFAAILLWSLLAVLSVGAGPVPPFLLTALAMATGGLAGLVWFARSGGLPRPRSLGTQDWLLGAGGLFLYHATYFFALQNAPVAEASLVAYLWPLLIVLFVALLPGERLSRRHILGAFVAFAGAALVIAGGTNGLSAMAPGHAAALACAVIWSGYSVLSRRRAQVPSGAVAWYCLAASALAAIAHLALETPRWPSGTWAWFAVALLGLGPLGAAFFLWDHGVKRGDIRLLGIGAYAAPVLSTALLVLAGQAPFSLSLLTGAALVAGGALAASLGGPSAPTGHAGTKPK
jgi:drug/metabolite transporter (DMT)-like permease